MPRLGMEFASSKGMSSIDRPISSVLLTLIALCTLTLSLASCEEDKIDSEVVAADEGVPEPAPRETLTFEKSNFSPFVEVSTDKKFVRVAFSFFPDGTDVDFERKIVGVLCTFPSNIPDDVNVQLTAPIEAEWDSPYVVAFPETTSLFTLDGIVMTVESAGMKFEPDFGIRLSADGIRDSFDGTLLSSSEGKLEDFYQLIIDKRD